jgi:hypothetical protein
MASARCNHAAITSVIRLRCVDGNLGFVLLYEFGKTTFPALKCLNANAAMSST